MNFYQRYELDRLIADGETKTFRAVENSSGRIVFLHFFNPEGRGILTKLKAKLGRIPGKPQFPLIELGEFTGSPYAVTEAIEPFTTLRQWVDSIDGDAPPSDDELTVFLENPKLAGETPKPTPVPPRPAGEFTQFFSPAPQPRAAEPPRAPVPDPPKPRMPEPAKPRVPEAPKPRVPEPGEFTRWFDPPAAAVPKSTPQPALPRAPEPGEFTRWFDPSPAAPSKPAVSKPSQQPPKPAPLPAKPAPQLREFEELFGGSGLSAPPQATPPQAGLRPSWPASSQSDPETGQFTRLFGSGPSGESIDIEEEQARAARTAQPESRPFQAPTEFTRVFGPEAGSNSPPPPLTRNDLAASGLFGSIADISAAAPAKPSGPGEYTRVTTRAELEAEQAALERSQAAPAPVAVRHGLLIALAIGGTLLVLALIAILVLVRKH